MPYHKDVKSGTFDGRVTQPLADKTISLAPLTPAQAITGLLAIPNPDATKPKPKRKKAPPTPDKE